MQIEYSIVCCSKGNYVRSLAIPRRFFFLSPHREVKIHHCRGKRAHGIYLAFGLMHQSLYIITAHTEHNRRSTYFCFLWILLISHRTLNGFSTLKLIVLEDVGCIMNWNWPLTSRRKSALVFIRAKDWLRWRQFASPWPQPSNIHHWYFSSFRFYPIFEFRQRRNALRHRSNIYTNLIGFVVWQFLMRLTS